MNKQRRKFSRAIWIALLAIAVIAPVVFVSSVSAKRKAAAALAAPQRQLPNTFDVRGPNGVPRGTNLRQPTAAQLKALSSLQTLVGAAVQVRYNGLTATPSHMFSLNGYLSAPSSAPPETIARNFLNRWKGIFRFSQDDVDNLRLKSRAFVPDMGATIMVFEQQASGLPVYHGEVLVNVNRAGQVFEVGSESFPQMQFAPTYTLTAAQAITAAADALGISNVNPQSLGTKQVLNSFGNLTPTYETGERFNGGNAFTGEIVVTKVAFPMGDTARPAYKFTLTTPQLSGITWQNFVDAETGQVLRRESLTAFQRKGRSSIKIPSGPVAGPSVPLGPPGGGNGTGRLATFRPDIQDRVESYNTAGTAAGQVFDSLPTSMSGPGGAGRPAAPGTPPTYQPETPNTTGFRFSLVDARHESPLVYTLPLGQVTRGFPDALNPSNESPLGWFYLPTGASGTEVTQSDTNRATTRAYGYVMSDEAKARNDHSNSPTGDGDQPFSATLTSLPSPRVLPDGRTLSSVFQSNYTEGNNVNVADDHANDNETTQGVRGYNPMHQFTSSLFTYSDSYEFGGVDASEQDPNTGGPCVPEGPCVVNFPPSTYPDIYPGAVNLFYFNNLIHDYLYSIGFTEPLWNFQQDNFGRGGAGDDGIHAQLQDGSGTDNSNFSTLDDGSGPTMQMYIFTDASFRRSDGSLDMDVVAHEHYHGVSNRSVGKGGSGCLGLGLIGEPSGQGEGWSDYNAISMTDDDAVGEYVTGRFDVAIRRLPYTNYRWSYGAVNGVNLNRRDQGTPDHVGGIPFEAHDTGELWAATLWDMRELLIMKDPNGVFFDGTRRLGSGTPFYIGYHLVQSVDTNHPIDYRASFNDSNGTTPTINAATHIVRPGLIAAEIATTGNRNGPLATALRNGARLSDTLVLRGMQLEPCNPSFVDSRDAILLADRELTGGENQAIIWRAFASHGVGQNAMSSTSHDPSGTNGEAVVEDFTVPAGVTQCETLGPLALPDFSLSNTQANTVTVTITAETGAMEYVISRATSAQGPFSNIATIPATQLTYNDNDGGNGLSAGQTFYYQVRASRTTDLTCVSGANTQSITVTVGQVITPAPIFTGVDQVLDPQACNRLIVNWQPATSLNPNADIVYDVYRTDEINLDTTQDPTFTPTAANRIAQGVNGTSFIDDNGGTGLKLNRVQYYIVQARDQNNGKLDTNNTGNTVAKFNAPSSPGVLQNPPFAFENFESSSADTRFAPPLTESGSTPNITLANFQRVTGVQIGNASTSMMYAPDFDPGGAGQGGPSNFSATIGPLTLAPTSVMEFDHFFSTEATFDGGVIEISTDPSFGGNNATPMPNNTNTFDLGNYIVQGGYNGKLDGTVNGVPDEVIPNRRAYTGSRGFHHVRIPLEDFALGGMHNTQGLPVYIRFRMTSDVGTNVGPTSGWYIDNLVVNNLDVASCPPLNPFQPGDVLISEFRTRGAQGPLDEFIELYNNTNAPIQVSSGDGTTGWSIVADISGTPTIIATIANGTNIPARGHYLITNATNPNGYSLGNYPGGANGATATGDATYTTDIPDGAGLALFSTAALANISASNRIDAVGFTAEANTLFREGAGLPSPGANDGEYSFVRRMAGTGLPSDTGDNAADFAFVSTTGGSFGGVQSTLGAPGPENSQSPIQRNATIKASLVDPNCSSTSTDPTTACARVRDTSATDPTTAPQGTLDLRRKFTNKTGQPVTRLRFRVVDVTTLGGRASSEADLRVLSSSLIHVTNSANQPVDIQGLTLEQPPTQTLGGGLNSTLSAGVITMATSLAPGNSINVHFTLGIVQGGNFRIFVNVEALP
jgi:Fungalysin metallopeptidase (M36)/Lamin Tail Domain/Fungalysin/Thermolysin Propeptide Motif/Peptidase propeptide and YPEB domain